MKSWLRNSRNNFHTSLQKVHEIIEEELNAIRSDFELNRTKIDHYCRNYQLFRRLGGIVSHYCIHILVEELSSEKKRLNCSCELQSTHGLPCACRMMLLKEHKIPIDPMDIHPFWKTLQLDKTYTWGETGKASAKELCEEAFREFAQSATEAQMRIFAEHMHEFRFPESVELEEPIHHKHKGRPPLAQGKRYQSNYEKKKDQKKDQRKTSKPRKRNSGPFMYESDMPLAILPYVEGWLDVEGDGNCGFRALGHYMYGGENTWDQVRMDILDEMTTNARLYRGFAGEYSLTITFFYFFLYLYKVI